MKCFVCDGECPEYGSVILNIDGDIVCSEKCKIRYNKEKDEFFNVIIHNDGKFAEYLGVNIDAIRNNF